ncbi:uncharacterized protein LOC127043868 isoform X4 [Gopherus flavomarginatus]|uniref:uncharacterized protein LOC127043868 isoform X4 n=1 Tax=Gopherus flavomarginatus TaxID=286002 RepID=UPI0021CB9EB1|nr:uncharacterized protein LOC127043868 isoform X4 [Gopherus flavomarginatus]
MLQKAGVSASQIACTVLLLVMDFATSPLEKPASEKECLCWMRSYTLRQIFEITGNVQELLQSRHTAPQKEPRLGPHLPSGADWSSPLQVTAAGSRPSGLQLPALERGFRRESLTDSWCCILSLRSCFATVTESNTASSSERLRTEQEWRRNCSLIPRGCSLRIRAENYRAGTK